MQFIKDIIAWYKRPKSKTADFFESLIVIIPVAFAIRTVIFGLYQVPTGSMETTLLVGERFFADKLTPYFRGPAYGEIIAFNDPNFDYSKNPLICWWQMYVGYPYAVNNWTKRVIGKPGDTIKGTIENGKPVVYRNGVKLDEPYLNPNPLIATYSVNRPDTLGWKSYVTDVAEDAQPYYRLTHDEISLGKRMVGKFGIDQFKRSGEPCGETSTIGGYEHPLDEFEVHLGPDEYWAMGDNRRGSYDSRAWGPLKKHLIHGRILFRIWSSDSSESWAIVDLLLHPIDFWCRVRWSRCMQIVR